MINILFIYLFQYSQYKCTNDCESFAVFFTHKKYWNKSQTKQFFRSYYSYIKIKLLMDLFSIYLSFCYIFLNSKANTIPFKDYVKHFLLLVVPFLCYFFYFYFFVGIISYLEYGCEKRFIFYQVSCFYESTEKLN